MICQACFNLQMQLYTSFPIEVFNVLVDDLEKMGLSNYFSWWTVQGSSTNDQLLMTLTKLRLNLKDLNLAERFNSCKFYSIQYLKYICCSTWNVIWTSNENCIPSKNEYPQTMSYTTFLDTFALTFCLGLKYIQFHIHKCLKVKQIFNGNILNTSSILWDAEHRWWK